MEFLSQNKMLVIGLVVLVAGCVDVGGMKGKIAKMQAMVDGAIAEQNKLF